MQAHKLSVADSASGYRRVCWSKSGLSRRASFRERRRDRIAGAGPGGFQGGPGDEASNVGRDRVHGEE